MLRLFIISALYVIISGTVSAQISRSFEFMHLPTNARIAALGGVNVSIHDKDPYLFFSNPALLEDSLRHNIGLTYQSYYGGINYGTVCYVNDFEKIGTIAVGIQYLNYGTLQGYDEVGNETADFKAYDNGLVVNYSRQQGHFKAGVNLKYATSSFSPYNAGALLLDLGGAFIHPNQKLTVGVNIKNIGFVTNDFTETSKSPLPFDLQVGASIKPAHMPLRFSGTIYRLYKGNIIYYNPESSILLQPKKPELFDKIMTHFAFGAEFLPSKNFNIRAGYNHLIRKELRLEQKSGGAGFSVGFSLKVKAFEIAYTKAFYHVASGNNYFTLTSNLGYFIKKKI